MADLTAFRDEVRTARRLAARTQQQLARAIGLHPHVLSHKLNGHPGSRLTSQDALAVVAKLTEWGAIATRTEAVALLEAAGVPERMLDAGAWGQTFALLDDEPEPERPAPHADLVVGTAYEEPERVRLRPLGCPAPPTPLVGRGSEVAAVLEAFETARLVSITGAGGIGKTRVALQCAAAMKDRFDDGIAFVELALFSDPFLIGPAILRALGLQPRAGDSAETQLVDALRGARVLVVLDNMEHVLAGADLLSRVLAAAPGVHLLVTSRSRLRLYGEHEIRLGPLGVASDRAAVAELKGSEAVELFLQRARAVRPGFDPGEEELRTVAALCALLDGLPLAIELVAARVRVWPPRVLLERVRERLPSVGDGLRDRPPRHRTLRATLAWSDALLEPADRAAFVRLAVFAGPFDAAGAAAVAGDVVDDAGERLERLEEQSLLEVARAGPVRPRFRMLEPVRQHALQQLASEGSLAAARRAHLRYFVDVASSMGPPRAGAAGDPELDSLFDERANLVAALSWACERAERDDGVLEDGMRLAAAAGRLWVRRALAAVGLRYLGRLLDVDARRRVVPGSLRLAILNRVATLRCNADDLDAAEVLASEALALAQDVGDRSGVVEALRVLGEAAASRGDLSRAEGFHVRQLAAAREGGIDQEVADALNELGQIHRRLGRHGEARRELEESSGLYAAFGDLDSVGSVHGSLGDLAFAGGELVSAGRHHAEALRLHARYGVRRGVAYALEGLAQVAATTGRPADALRYVGTARRIRRDDGWVLPGPDRAALEEVLTGPASTLSDVERRRAVTAGRLDDPDEVVADALRSTASFLASPHPPHRTGSAGDGPDPARERGERSQVAEGP